MSDWDFAEEHRQARRTLGMLQRALSLRARNPPKEQAAQRQWMSQLEQAIDELTCLTRERRFSLEIRQGARILRHAARVEAIQTGQLLAKATQNAERRERRSASAPPPQAKPVDAAPTKEPIVPKFKAPPAMSAKHAEQVMLGIREKCDIRATIPVASLDWSQLLVRQLVVAHNVENVEEILKSPHLGFGLRNEVQSLFQILIAEQRQINMCIASMRDARKSRTPSPGLRSNRRESTQPVDVSPIPEATRLPFVVLGGECPLSLPELRNYIQLFHKAEPSDVHDESRLEFLYTFYPTGTYAGRDDFNRYYVLEFAHFQAAVFECPRVGNAVYVVELGAWQTLARKSKAELRGNKTGAVRWVLHSGDWQSRLRTALDSFRLREKGI